MPVSKEGIKYTADEAYAKGECPECGVPLDSVNLEDHVRLHWSSGISNALEHTEARRRRDLILNFKPAALLEAAKD